MKHNDSIVVTKYKMAVKNVDLLTFDSDNLVGWTKYAETYFEVHGSPKKVKIRLRNVHMEDETIHWFNFLYEAKYILTC